MRNPSNKCSSTEQTLACTPSLHELHVVPQQANRPKIAILREQGVNGQIEMAAAFTHAGSDAIDVHMSDLQEGRIELSNVQGLVACGGFSYGDVLGAGRGWASSILFNEQLRESEHFSTDQIPSRSVFATAAKCSVSCGS